MVKNPPTNSEDSGLTPGSGISPSEGNSNLLIVFLPGKSQGQRSLEGYSPWGHQEVEMTEQLNKNNLYVLQIRKLKLKDINFKR